MKKFINNPEKFVSDTLSGVYKAHSDKICHVNNDLHCLTRKKKLQDKVALVTGGGSGHLPLFLGYVGDGLLDGCAVGEVFRSPNSEQVYEVLKAVDTGKGVLCIIGNYNGDIFNFTIAAKKAREVNGIDASIIIVTDDIASSNVSTRRGTAGLFFIYKCAGAAAAQGKSLEEVKHISELALERTRSIGVALSPCVIPESGAESFHSNGYNIELGVGIHGERGVIQSKIMTAKKTAKTLLDKLIEDLKLQSHDTVGVLINGLGSTPLEEQYIIYDSVHQILTSHGILIQRVFIGEFATTLDMAGLSISLIKLNDELEELINSPANAIMYHQGDAQ